jgi:hypothetical protein
MGNYKQAKTYYSKALDIYKGKDNSIITTLNRKIKSSGSYLNKSDSTQSSKNSR